MHVRSIDQQVQAKRRGGRRGAATVELAVLLPVIIVIVLGAMEAASLIFLRQAVVQSAYEAVKVAAKTGDQANAQTAATDVANGRQIQQFRVDFSPQNLNSVTRGQLIRVTVSAPGDSNSVLPFGPFRGRIVSASAAMIRE